MIMPIFVGALYCVTPKLDNRTDTWNKQDQETLLLSQKVGCKQFDPKKPCLTTFIKLEEGKYDALCSAEVPRKDK